MALSLSFASAGSIRCSPNDGLHDPARYRHPSIITGSRGSFFVLRWPNDKLTCWARADELRTTGTEVLRRVICGVWFGLLVREPAQRLRCVAAGERVGSRLPDCLALSAHSFVDAPAT